MQQRGEKFAFLSCFWNYSRIVFAFYRLEACQLDSRAPAPGLRELATLGAQAEFARKALIVRHLSFSRRKDRFDLLTVADGYLVRTGAVGVANVTQDA